MVLVMVVLYERNLLIILSPFVPPTHQCLRLGKRQNSFVDTRVSMVNVHYSQLKL